MTARTVMGPIERELRERNGKPVRPGNWLSYQAFCLLMGAEESLGLHGPIGWVGRTDEAQAELNAILPDIYSEAIEAAEALKL
jgi:hypothetical protein